MSFERSAAVIERERSLAPEISNHKSDQREGERRPYPLTSGVILFRSASTVGWRWMDGAECPKGGRDVNEIDNRPWTQFSLLSRSNER